ncbi:MAG TPA: hypothetical protein VM166_06280 [Gemmatimonadaceae bacterium]|nr:hypothetical protein [Gemmatimonadaceae bacterium]
MKAILQLVVAAFLATAAAPAGSIRPSALTEDILARSRAAYAALNTYADVGTVTVNTGGFVDRAKFRTYRRKPRDFFYEFTQISTSGSGGSIPMKGHLILWMRNGNLEKWDEQGKLHESFPAGVRNQITPIANLESTTAGASSIIAALLFQKVGIVSALEELVTTSLAGTENLRGTKTYKIMGIAQSTYPSGKTFNVRPVTIWVDAQTYLIRQVLIDTPKSYAVGSIRQITITFDPQVNPPLDDSKFQYRIPSE